MSAGMIQWLPKFPIIIYFIWKNQYHRMTVHQMITNQKTAKDFKYIYKINKYLEYIYVYKVYVNIINIM